jgi:hypothetical protein
MKKAFLFTLLLCACFSICKSQLFITKSGHITFFSEAPLENIDATSKSLNAVLDTKSEEIVFNVPITSFQFKKSLMQEHFNEKYLESKNATFKGKIVGPVDYSKDSSYPVTVTGILTLHGVEKKYSEKGLLIVKGNEITLSGKFYIVLKDHKIEVPALVASKIAERVLVTLLAVFNPYKK